ncbi:phosphatidate cytidylyltransferase [Chelatococcus sp. SYSU_G07232]|uniref:Phosphatidate cytidylyltransferase n=1 Tax=Chelatococcus albus TaxID=3047466 RepID=A0ABT7ABQ9_9HYPH|nr:phosphatidate cytidylyltransferase [Chelatococcus sp. SYSU_G07232]MDJ1156773.1 phosphatidate cytidylyltransferase [Chelatococcus sp. SYSU_G07232]
MASQGPPGTPGLAGSELGLRVASALVLGVVALATAYWGGLPFVFVWTGAAAAIALEWLSLARVEPETAEKAVVGTGVGLTGLAAGTTSDPRLAAVALLLTLAAAVLVGRSRRDRLWAAGGALYAAVIALVPILVRQAPGLGLAVLLWMFAVVWATDIVAYFTGRSLGGPKLWPRVSPKKTWSGFVGGTLAGTFAGAMVAAAAQGRGIAVPLGYGTVVALSAIASIAGQFGDLAESALKRRAGVKDSGHLIPGHGGVMDRLDAFWAVAAIVALASAALQLSAP